MRFCFNLTIGIRVVYYKTIFHFLCIMVFLTQYDKKTTLILCCNLEIREGQTVVLNTIDKYRIILGFTKKNHVVAILSVFELI